MKRRILDLISRYLRGRVQPVALVGMGALAAILGGAVNLRAGVIWNETVNGDISNNRLAPTSVALLPGDNDVLGSVRGSPSDLDYLNFVVPAGRSLASLTLLSYSGIDGTAFIGLQQGATFTEPTIGTVVGNLKGYTHFGTVPGNVGANILPAIGTGPGAQGFVPPLGAGSYTLWIQQLGSVANYGFRFSVTPVPEPATLGLCATAVGLWGLAAIGRRGRRQPE